MTKALVFRGVVIRIPSGMKNIQEKRFEETYGPARDRKPEDEVPSTKSKKVLLPKLNLVEILAGVISAFFLIGGLILGGFLLLLGIGAIIVFTIWFGLSWLLSPRRYSGKSRTLIVRRID